MRPIEQQSTLITGATDGLGRAVASELAGQGARLLLHGRSEERGKRALSEIKARTGNEELPTTGLTLTRCPRFATCLSASGLSTAGSTFCSTMQHSGSTPCDVSRPTG